MISRENDLANTIRKRIKENKERKKRLERDRKRKEKQMEIQQERIAKLQQESREREIERERQQIKDANREAGKKAEPHTYNITGKPDYLKEKKIELSINSKSLAEKVTN